MPMAACKDLFGCLRESPWLAKGIALVSQEN